jgi:nucleoside-diphosphate-sugar epimerase
MDAQQVSMIACLAVREEMQMRAVVTGVAGFIGSHLVEALLERGDEVIGVDSFTSYYDPGRKRSNLEHVHERVGFRFVEGDVNSLDLGELLTGVDVVYHLAGQPGVRASWGTEFDVYLDQNILTTQKLLEAAKDVELHRFVLASSSSIYGQAEHFPTNESEKPLPLSPYGVTKFSAEQLCHLYKTAFDVPATMLRYFSIFGPRQRPDMAFSRFIDAALNGRPMTILGDGGQSRDFTYVGDAVAATLAAAEKGVTGRPYNVAGGCQATVLEVIETLERILEQTLEREHLDPMPGDPRKTGADISAAQQDLDYVPAVGLEEGLTRQLDNARGGGTEVRRGLLGP